MLKYYIREFRENVKSELKSTLESNNAELMLRQIKSVMQRKL